MKVELFMYKKKNRMLSLPARSHLFRAGDRIENLYLVKTGKVSLYVRNETGAVEKRRVENGGIIGVGQFTGKKKWEENAIAMLDSEILPIPVKSAEEQLENLPDFWRGLIIQLSDQLDLAQKENFSLKKIEEEINNEFESTLAKCLEILSLAGRCARINHAPSDREIRTVCLKLHAMPFFYVQNVMGVLEELGWLQTMTENDEICHRLEISKIDSALFLILQAIRNESENLLVPSLSESRLLKTLSSMSRYVKPNGRGVARVWASELAQEIRDLGFEPDMGQIDRIHKRGLELSKLSTDEGIMIEFHAEDVNSVSTAWELLCASRRAAPFTAQ